MSTCARFAGAGILLSFLPSCKGISYIPHAVQNDQIVVKKADAAGQPFVIIQPEGLPAPVYLCLLENGDYSAVLLQCTHRGCELRPTGGELHCPCHGSVFSKTGEVLESPAERPLRQFRVSVDDQNIYIQ